MPSDRGYNRYGLECGLRSVEAVIDPRIGQRFKEARERIGLTQEELAEITGYSVNYISTVERGVSFPRCERLITLMNTLNVSADSIFCDVLENTVSHDGNTVWEKLQSLSPQAQKRILDTIDFLIEQELTRK